MQITYVFTAFPQICNKWCLHGVGRVMLLTTCLYNASIWYKESKHFYQSKRWKNRLWLLNYSTVVSFQLSLPTHFLPWSLCCYLYSKSCFTGEVEEAASFARVSRWWEEPISDPWGWTHTKGLWAGMFPGPEEKSGSHFPMIWNRKEINNTGQTKEVLLCNNIITQFSSFTVCSNTSALSLQ